MLLVGAAGYWYWQQQYTQDELPPLTSITYQDILNHPSLEQGVMQAVKANDMQQVAQLQAKAVEIGEAAGFDEIQMSALQGEKARQFMLFKAKRSLFYQEFEQAYQQLQPIEPIKSAYPEAQSLFEQADALIRKRDASIEQAAKILATEQGATRDYLDYLPQARQQWLARQQLNAKDVN